ncbi:MAG: cupin domain-containing protein [Candidatus Hydrogenedentota bacterium]
MSKVKISQPTKEEKDKLGLNTWGVWSCGISKFPWEYSDRETCYIIEGEVTVKTDEGDYSIKAGDLVTFESGLSCEWDVKKPIKKYYRFG